VCQHRHELIDNLLLSASARLKGIRDTMLDVASQDLESRGVQRRAHGGDLREDLGAGLFRFHHATDALDLAGDVAQALKRPSRSPPKDPFVELGSVL